jgi:hypothetical protein
MAESREAIRKVGSTGKTSARPTAGGRPVLEGMSSQSCRSDGDWPKSRNLLSGLGELRKYLRAAGIEYEIE